ncbi:MAG: hypothetical protein R3F59_07755 [Myxococcota bacterium]
MRATLLLLLLSAALAGCPAAKGTDTADTGAQTAALPLEIVGSYTDAFGTTHDIDEDAWVQTYPGYDPLRFEVAWWDNAEGRLVAHNDPANAYAGDLWSAFDWTWTADDHLYYCQSAFDADSEDAAGAAPAADADDLDAGCGGFAWTDLTP